MPSYAEFKILRIINQHIHTMPNFLIERNYFNETFSKKLFFLKKGNFFKEDILKKLFQGFDKNKIHLDEIFK